MAERIALVGNCQMGVMAEALRRNLPGVSVDVHEFWAMKPEDYPAAIAAVREATLVIAQPHHAEKFGALSYGRIRQTFEGQRIFFISNLFFHGPVPDCTPLRPPKISLMSGVHSRIVVASFLAGLGEAVAVARLAASEGIDPVARWRTSLSHFRRRQEETDVDFADELDALTRQRRCFHTMNHPTAFIIDRYTEKVVRTVYAEPGFAISQPTPDLLGARGSWPVLPSVARPLGLAYESEVFRMPERRGGGGEMSLAEYVAAAYEIYAGIDPALLRPAVQRPA